MTQNFGFIQSVFTLAYLWAFLATSFIGQKDSSPTLYFYIEIGLRLVWLFLLIWGLHTLWIELKKRNTRFIDLMSYEKANRPALMWFGFNGLTILLLAVGIIYHWDKTTSLTHLSTILAMIVSGTILPLILLSQDSSQTTSHSFHFLRYTSIAISIIILVGLILFFSGINLFGKIERSYYFWGSLKVGQKDAFWVKRFQGFFDNPNTFALFTLPILLLQHEWITREQSVRSKLFWFFSAVILSVSLVLSFSRSIIIIVFFSSIITLIRVFYHKIKIIIPVLAIGVGIFISQMLLLPTKLLNQYILTRVLGGNLTFVSYFGGRYDLWRVALKEFLHNPFLGTGQYNVSYPWQDTHQIRLINPHNIILNILLLYGLPVMILVFFVLSRYFFLKNKVMPWVVFWLFVNYLAHGGFMYNFSFPWIVMMFIIGTSYLKHAQIFETN